MFWTTRKSHIIVALFIVALGSDCAIPIKMMSVGVRYVEK